MSAPATARLLRRDPLAEPLPEGTVDAHVHVTPVAPEGSEELSGTGSAQALLPPFAAARLMRGAGVARALACPPKTSHYAATNASMLAACEVSDGVLLPAARLGGRIPLITRSPWAARRALRSRTAARAPDAETLEGFAAIALAPHLDGVPDDTLLAEVRARRLPVVVHAGAACPPAWVARHLLPRLAGCPVVLAHLGALPASAADLTDAVALAREGRVWLDTAAAWLAEFVALAVREAPGRVLFASAAPYLTPQVAWAHVAAAVTDDGLLAHVASGAALEVFGDAAGPHSPSSPPSPHSPSSPSDQASSS